ncbi:ATP-binding domain-containing protein [Pedobacter lusitanus]|uniref:ATP-binding domain-containing protein n=1 Tax=Pedobacter lusitanus TaxID=1503925 RepID=A0A0D0GI77_9SPHI|nr:ATP-binding domain-containing protein [Pedobacter lusitanus]KIO76972.1 ATP-binding domain-containing protein [Pedobacter lusitanus]
MNKLKTYFNWSTGKDSALALHYLLQDKNYSIEHLLTSVNRQHNRVSMHGLRRELFEQQIEALNLPYSTIELPEQPSMQEYETLMEKEVSSLQQEGFTHAAFGDIFLEDLRKYREQQLAALHIKSVFPLWKKDTRQLLTEFIDLGFKSVLVCIKADLLDPSFAGRVIDADFIKDLPPNVDVCGENGEFHTFCFDGPIFKNPIPFEIGEKVYREYQAPKTDADSCSSQQVKGNSGFWFCDLLPISGG